MPEYGLVAEGLVKRYQNRRYGDVLALDDFALTAERGEIVGLVGANGSGKTTFVETVIGLVRPNQGTVRVCGVDMIRHPRVGRGHLGYAPQESAMYVSATVRENLQVFGGLVGLRRQSLRLAVDDAVAAMRLDTLMDRPVGWLSGGQRRRVQVATALLGTPELLLLDEPTAGADLPTRQALLAAVRARASAGAAIVYTTHYLPELADLDATLAVVKAGRVVARGDQKELLAGLPGEVRLKFDGPVPDQLRRHGRLVEQELRLSSNDPGQTLAEVLASGCVPVSVDVLRPGLDDLYTSLEAVPAHVN
jgi:ABC-type multidrug transport system ATPase subunit